MRSLALALLLFACSCPQPVAPGGPSEGPPATVEPSQPAPSEPPPPTGKPAAPQANRALAIPADHPMHPRVEGTSFQNACTRDAQCFTGGCSSEVCSAEEGVSSTCEAPADGWPTAGATCGCVSGQCSWYRGIQVAPPPRPAPPASAPAPASSALPDQGKPCSTDGRCAAGLTCSSYYGIAGPRGPQFTSCEIPCAGKSCPSGQRCVTIADGPGQVCRP